MRLAYIRVSTVEQNEERQVEAMKRYDIEKWFIEKVSAKDTNRPKLHRVWEVNQNKIIVFAWNSFQ